MIWLFFFPVNSHGLRYVPEVYLRLENIIYNAFQSLSLSSDSCKCHNSNTMTSSSTSPTLSTADSTSTTIDNRNFEFDGGLESDCSNNNVSTINSDPWEFLEKELAEFKRIVAELEQIKMQNNRKGRRNWVCSKHCLITYVNAKWFNSFTYVTKH